MRHAVADFVEANPQAELGGSPLSDWIRWESEMGVQAYCSRMRRAGEWGGAIEMAVFSRIFGVSVLVFEKLPRKPGEFQLISAFDADKADGAEEGGAAVCRVLYSGRVHYDAIEV